MGFQSSKKVSNFNWNTSKNWSNNAHNMPTYRTHVYYDLWKYEVCPISTSMFSSEFLTRFWSHFALISDLQDPSWEKLGITWNLVIMNLSSHADICVFLPRNRTLVRPLVLCYSNVLISTFSQVLPTGSQIAPNSLPTEFQELRNNLVTSLELTLKWWL